MPVPITLCPDCEGGILRQLATSDWWECDHCTWKGTSNAVRLGWLARAVATQPPAISPRTRWA